MGPICKTCPANNFSLTEPFPTIPSALDSVLKYLSNNISYVYIQICPGGAKEEHVNKETGNFQFSFKGKGNTVGIVKISRIFWDRHNRILSTSENPCLIVPSINSRFLHNKKNVGIKEVETAL